MQTMSRYDAEVVKKLVSDIANRAGVSEGDALLFADALVEADVQGTSTHGVSRLNIYVRRIRKGLINPKAEIILERKSGSVVVIDADNGLGQVQAHKALEILLPMARATGCASATVKNSQHFGALSYYCNRAAQMDMILIAMTNCEPSMSPEGGCQAFFGTNPIAASFPTGKGYPVKIDLSTSVVARGNIIAAQRKGQDIPLGWALDREGNPTRDPEEALEGTVLAMAGYKGYALAMMVEIFSGVLSGAAVGPSVGSMYRDWSRRQDVGHFFCLMNIAPYMDVDRFKSRMDAMIDDIKACRKRPGTDEILVPGERSFRRSLENREKGIPLGEETIGELGSLCEEFGIPFTLRAK